MKKTTTAAAPSRTNISLGSAPLGCEGLRYAFPPRRQPGVAAGGSSPAFPAAGPAGTPLRPAAAASAAEEKGSFLARRPNMPEPLAVGIILKGEGFFPRQATGFP